MHWISVRRPRGERVRELALWDGGAQIAALDKGFYLSVAKRLGPASAPTKKLRMADGRVVSTYGRWEGDAEVEGVRVRGAFNIFDSGGGWRILFGKPLQEDFGVVHDMKADVVTLCASGRTAKLTNQNPAVWTSGIREAAAAARTKAALEAARRRALTGDESYAISPTRRVPSLPVSKPLDPHHNAKPVQIVSMATEKTQTQQRKRRCTEAERQQAEENGAVTETATREAVLGARTCETPPVRRVDSVVERENIDAADRAGPSAWIEEVGSDDVEGAAVAAGEDGFEEWDEDEDELERSGDKIPDAGVELATATRGACEASTPSC
ncbi:hypothetical protein B0H17DRAFT_1196527 [Mycena rosella]|uniref:Uncharacterized protein n=1 Tax=Mycena rosella TaxID=1033263 RepID=A0AAD7DU05_MYCRO|nr:hypothetical protein B0H17DRAFT_1196527 [Mycena rosella]